MASIILLKLSKCLEICYASIGKLEVEFGLRLLQILLHLRNYLMLNETHFFLLSPFKL